MTKFLAGVLVGVVIMCGAFWVESQALLLRDLRIEQATQAVQIEQLRKAVLSIEKYLVTAGVDDTAGTVGGGSGRSIL